MPPRDGEVLTPSTYECDLFWKEGVRRCSSEDGVIGAGPNPK